MNQSNEGFINIVIAVIIVVVIGVVGYFALSKKSETPSINSDNQNQTSTSPNGTSNWKTYSDEKFGIEIKYPPNRETFFGGISSTTSIGILVSATGSGGSGRSDIDIDNVAIGMTNHKLGPPYGNNPKISKLVVDGQEARLITPTNSNVHLGLIVRYPKPHLVGDYDNKYEFLTLDILQKNGYVGYEADMIKTIKFLNSPEINPTANWQTYTDGKFGFSFKYPLYWKFESKDQNIKGLVGSGIKSLGGFPTSKLLSFSHLGGVNGQVDLSVGNIDCTNDSEWTALSELAGLKNPPVPSRENFIVNGVKIFKLTYATSSCVDCLTQTRVCVSGNPSLVFFYDGTRPDIFDKVISTFKPKP